MTEVTTYYLEMRSKLELNAKTMSNGLSVIEAEIDEFQFNRFLYQFVGAAWQWSDNLKWSDDEWRAYVENPSLRTWVAYYKGSLAGYFELNANISGDTEIVYFGLASSFIGKGFGGYFLSQAIKNAWEIPTTKRLWVHTCSLDHVAALNNYKSRGFKIYKTETQCE